MKSHQDWFQSVCLLLPCRGSLLTIYYQDEWKSFRSNLYVCLLSSLSLCPRCLHLFYIYLPALLSILSFPSPSFPESAWSCPSWPTSASRCWRSVMSLSDWRCPMMNTCAWRSCCCSAQVMEPLRFENRSNNHFSVPPCQDLERWAHFVTGRDVTWEAWGLEFILNKIYLS